MADTPSSPRVDVLVAMWIAVVLVHVLGFLGLGALGVDWVPNLTPEPITGGIFTPPRDTSRDGIQWLLDGLRVLWWVAPALWFGAGWKALARFGWGVGPLWRWAQVWGALFTAGVGIGGLVFLGASSAGSKGLDLLMLTVQYGMVATSWAGLTGVGVVLRQGVSVRRETGLRVGRIALVWLVATAWLAPVAGSLVFGPPLSALAVAPLMAAVLWGLVAWAVPPWLLRAAEGVGGPVRRSGRVFGWDWVGDASGVQWVPPEVAKEWRRSDPAVAASPTVSGFELSVAPSDVPFPVGGVSVAAVVTMMLPSLLISLTGLALTGAFSLVSGSDGELGSIVAWMVGTVFTHMVFYPVIMSPTVLLAALGRLLAHGFAQARDGGRVERVGRVLRTPSGPFTLGEKGQVVMLTWGWRGARLELANARERVVLHGEHGALAWLAAEVRGVKTQGPEEVPEALRGLVARARATEG